MAGLQAGRPAGTIVGIVATLRGAPFVLGTFGCARHRGVVARLGHGVGGTRFAGAAPAHDRPSGANVARR
jgi:hypothetical protein